MTRDEHKARLPTYRLEEIFGLKRKIQNDPELVALTTDSEPLSGEDFDVLSRRLRDLLPPGIEMRVIMDSLVHLAGDPLTPKTLALEAWRLAANVGRLKRHLPVRPWQRQGREEWVPLEVIDQVECRNWREDLGATITFRILAGSPAGMTTERFWTIKAGKYIGSKIGFGPPWDKYRFERLSELTRLRLFGLLLPEKSLDKPKFEQVECTTGLKEYNRKILKDRMRERSDNPKIQNFVCPKQYTHPCYMCQVGYQDCHCGTHPRTYVKEMCGVCHRLAWMDPLHVPLKICVLCLNKKNKSKERKN